MLYEGCDEEKQSPSYNEFIFSGQVDTYICKTGKKKSENTIRLPKQTVEYSISCLSLRNKTMNWILQHNVLQHLFLVDIACDLVGFPRLLLVKTHGSGYAKHRGLILTKLVFV